MVDPISIAIFGGAAAFMYDVHRRAQADREERRSRSTTGNPDTDPMRNEGGYDTFHDYNQDQPTGHENEDLDTADLDQYQ